MTSKKYIDKIRELDELEKKIFKDKPNWLRMQFEEKDNEEIDKIRNTKMQPINKKRLITLHLILGLTKEGKWFYTADLKFYYFYNEIEQLINIDSLFFTLLLHKKFHFNRTDSEFEHFVCELKSIIYNNLGEKTTIHKVCFFDKARHTLYIHNNDSLVYKISKDKIETEKNGIDGVLFLVKNYETPFFAETEQIPVNIEDIIFDCPNYSNNSLLSPTEAKQIFKYWFFFSFFIDIYPTRPILAFIGEKGSAKTMSLKLIKSLFYGELKKEIYTLTENKREAEDYVSSNFFHFFDNQDNKITGRTSWTEDFLATLATGFELERRKLYTDDETWHSQVKGIPAITARTPYFKRDDVADRLLIIELERRKDFKTEKELFANLNQNKNKLWGFVLLELQQIIKRLSDNDFKGKINFRLADFAHFMYSISPNSKKIDKLIVKLAKNQDQFTLEENPIFQALEIWMENVLNHRFQLSTKGLFSDLSEIAEANNIDDFPKSTISFGKRFSNIKSNLINYFMINETRTRTRTKVYSFQMKE